jgi:hypothetical protein
METMLFYLFIAFQLFYSVTCHVSCYDCPIQANTFDSILTPDTMPENFKNCSFTGEQMECSIRVTWTQDPNKTAIALIAGGERSEVSGEHNLENTITLSNNGVKLAWAKSIFYKCSTERCNNPGTLNRLLRSLRSDDDFHALSSLLAMNTQFSSGLCYFFANSSVPCETEMDPNTCKQCVTEEYMQSKPVEICSNCAMNNITENSMLREVKFFMEKRERHDFWMIQCQQKDCNAIETGDLVRQKSNIQFNFDLFLNGGDKFTNVSSLRIIMIFALIIIKMKIFS